MSKLAQNIRKNQAKVNMITQQIRTNGVESSEILALLTEIPRDIFVPMEYEDLAYSDTELPIGHHQVMLSPMLEAQILQYLELSKNDTVLEVGTGSGYLTALMAKLSRQVYSVDKYSEFSHNAARKLARLNIHNVVFETGNGAQGWLLHEPYNAIVMTGSLAFLPQPLLEQLAVGGRLFAVVGAAPCQTATLVKRVSQDKWQQQKLFETVLPPLEDANTPNKFIF